MKRKWDSSNDTRQRACVDEIITKVDEITDSSIGVIAAQELIDIVTEHFAPEIYDRGVEDAKKALSAKITDIEIELEALKQDTYS